MLTCEGVRFLAMASVAVAMLLDAATVAHIVCAAVVEGICAALFLPAEQASLPNVVRPEQVSAAVARNTARSFLATLAGPGLAGVLLGIQRMLPFLANAGTYLLSFCALIFVRIPRNEVGPRTPLSGIPRDIATGVAWLWRRPPVRVIILLAIALILCISDCIAQLKFNG